MKSVLLATALVAAPGLTRAEAPAFPFERQMQTLGNGLRVVYVPFDSPGLVAYYTLVRVGSRNEVEPGHTGFAHFFEHMMFRGTPRNPSFDAEMARVGWHNNAWTWDDETVYTDFGPTATLPRVIELEADRFRNLQYDEPAFRTEAGAVLGEYNKSLSSPWMKLGEVLSGTAYTTHTYRHTTIGLLEDIKTMPEKYEYSKRFHKRFYTPDNTVLFVVGDFDRAAVHRDIERHYGDWSGTVEALDVPPEPPQTEERRAQVDWPSATLPRQLFAYKVPPATDWKASAAAEVVYAYVFGPTSRLHEELVLKRQIAEPFASWSRPQRDPGLFTVMATAKDVSGLPEIEKAVDAALASLAGGALEPERLARIKSNVRYGLLIGLDDAEKVAQTLAAWISPTGDVEAPDRYLRALEALTAEDVVAFARARLVPEQRTVVTLMPKAAAEGGAK